MRILLCVIEAALLYTALTEVRRPADLQLHPLRKQQWQFDPE